MKQWTENEMKLKTRNESGERNKIQWSKIK